MSQGYDDAADIAQDRGVLRPYDNDPREVQAKLRRFLNIENPNASGAQKLIRETQKRAMDQTIRSADGDVFGTRRGMDTWVDRWGNVMAQNRDGDRSKIVDNEDLQ